QIWHSEVNSWRHCESEDNVGTYRCDVKAERQSHVRSTQNLKHSCGHVSKSLKRTKVNLRFARRFGASQSQTSLPAIETRWCPASGEPTARRSPSMPS